MLGVSTGLTELRTAILFFGIFFIYRNFFFCCLQNEFVFFFLYELQYMGETTCSQPPV